MWPTGAAGNPPAGSRAMEAVLSDHIEWLPEVEAPSGKWLLVRAMNRDTNDFDKAPRQAVKLGGMWWTADHKFRELVPLDLEIAKGEFIGAIWFAVYTCATTRVPDEWCDIPDSVMARLVNRMPIPASA